MAVTIRMFLNTQVECLYVQTEIPHRRIHIQPKPFHELLEDRV